MSPSGEVGGIPRYLDMIRTGRWIIVGALVLCVGAAALYLANASKVYEASADVLVVPQSNLLVPVPGIVQESSDPTRDVETVARLVTAPSVTQRVIRELNLRNTSSEELQRKVAVTPVAQSNIVTITGKAGTPEEAKQLADAMGEAFINDRTDRLHQTLDAFIGRLEPAAEADGAASNTSDNSPRAQLAFLRYLRQGPDPSVRLESRAELPTGAVSPRPLLTIVAALLAGLLIGLVGALGLQLLDPRLRREEDLRARFRLPILARVPLERRRRKRPLLPSEMSLAALDGFQALRVALSGDQGPSLAGRVVLVTGPSPGDGKTTAAINLASTLAAAGKRTILVEADSRRPSVGRALGAETTVGLSSVVTGRNYLVDALVPVGSEDSKLRVVLNAPDEPPAADMLSRIAADTLMLQARRLADWVIVDAPPLNHVAETLALARAVDDVVVVVRIGGTNNRDLTELAEMLGQQDVTPAGFVVFGGHARTSYY